MHEHHDHFTDHDHPFETHSAEERLALLSYMLHHNAQHADELHQLGHEFEGEVYELIHQACDDFQAGNMKLAKALQLLNK